MSAISTLLAYLGPVLPLVALLCGALLCGLAAVFILQRAQHRDGRPARDTGAVPAAVSAETAPSGDTSLLPGALEGALHVNMLAWRARDVWAATGLVLDLWGARISHLPTHDGTQRRRDGRRLGKRAADGQATGQRGRVVDLYVRGQTTHVRAATGLVTDLARALGAEVAVQGAGPRRGVVRVWETHGPPTVGEEPYDVASALRAHAVLAPLGTLAAEGGGQTETEAVSDTGAPVSALLFGEVHRGLLVVARGPSDRGSEALLAVTCALLADWPRGSAALWLCAAPLSPLRALATAPEMAAPPCTPDDRVAVGSLLERVVTATSHTVPRGLTVVVLEDLDEAWAGAEALCQHLETLVAQGPGRGVVVLASTRAPGVLGEALTPFTCRLVLGPARAEEADLAAVLPHGVSLPDLEEGAALCVDRREGAACVVQALLLDAAGAARALDLSPAPLELADAQTTDAPCLGRTLIEVRLLGQLTVGPVAGAPLRPKDGWRRQSGELVAYLATHWGWPLTLAEIAGALSPAVPTRGHVGDPQDAAGELVRAAQRALVGAAGPAVAGTDAPLHYEQAGVLLNTRTAWADSVAFAGLCAAAGAAKGERTRLALLERALALYAGDFLGDAPVSGWAEAERARLRALSHAARRDAVRCASALGLPAEACAHARQLVQALGAADEEATLLLLEALAAAGDAPGLAAAYGTHAAATRAAQGQEAAPAVRLAYEALAARLTGVDGPAPTHGDAAYISPGSAAATATRTDERANHAKG